jgi:hypothetical protein
LENWLAHRVGDFGAAVTDVHHRESGVGVEQPPAPAVPDIDALAALDHEVLVGPGRMILGLVRPQVLDELSVGHGSSRLLDIDPVRIARWRIVRDPVPVLHTGNLHAAAE